MPNLEVVLYVLRSGERPHARALRGRLDILVRREVVWHQRDLRAVEHSLAPELRELADGDWRRDVVRQHEIELCHHQFARAYCRPVGHVRREDFLCHRHAHVNTLLSCLGP